MPFDLLCDSVLQELQMPRLTYNDYRIAVRIDLLTLAGS